MRGDVEMDLMGRIVLMAAALSMSLLPMKKGCRGSLSNIDDAY
jgi:hypothetical protein